MTFMKTAVVRGRSGALLYVNPHVTVKTVPLHGPDGDRCRVVAQGAMMQDLNMTGLFPFVYSVFDTGYAMETLLPITWRNEAHVLKVLHHAVCKLNSILWQSARQPSSTFDCLWVGQATHEDYVLSRCYTYARQHEDKLLHAMRMMRSIMPNLQPATFLHGDPTLANMMCTKQAEHTLVITDPIPQDGRLAQIAAVDRGKLLQSAWGYEHVIDASFPTIDRHEAESIVLDGLDGTEEYAARYFLFVHILRLLPYHPADMRPTFVQWLDDIEL